MSRTFVAPGKVVVAGEYAVLDGAPALVAAVDLGVGVTVHPADTRRATSPTGDTRFVDAALDATDAPASHYAFFDLDRPDLSGKPGLGGSGAATVVATWASWALQGRSPTPAQVFDLAYRVHHGVQGSGSGVDVAASSWGGMLRFVRGERPTPVPPVDLVVVWSGRSAATGPRVGRYRAWTPRQAFVDASAAGVEGFHDDPIARLDEARRLLEAMAADAGLDYRTAALDHIGRLARDHGGAAKPSGAGGGDCAVAILPDPEARAAFTAACDAAGHTVLSTTLARGVREDDAPRS